MNAPTPNLAGDAAFDLYEASVPVFTHALENLSLLLRKAEAHAQAQALDPASLIEARLAPDMFNLARQVQSAADAAKICTARLAGQKPPSDPDTETTFDELQARIAKTLGFIRSVDPALIASAIGRVIEVPLPSGSRHFTGRSYLLKFCLPNFFFHAATAYGILRHKGVAIGKLDYLGTF
jgi:hypothetical protein